MEITWVCRVGKSRISASPFTVKVRDILADCPRSPISQTSLGEPYPKGPKKHHQIKEKLTSNSLQCLERKPHQPLPVFRRILFSRRIEIRLLWREENREDPGEKPSEQGENEDQTQETYGNWPESNPGHTGGRRALSLQRHLCSSHLMYDAQTGYRGNPFRRAFILYNIKPSLFTCQEVSVVSAVKMMLTIISLFLAKNCVLNGPEMLNFSAIFLVASLTLNLDS